MDEYNPVQVVAEIIFVVIKLAPINEPPVPYPIVIFPELIFPDYAGNNAVTLE